MKRIRKSLSMLLSAVLIVGCVFVHPMQARAEEAAISFTLRLSCAPGVTPPNHYGASYELLDSEGRNVDLGEGSVVSINGSGDGSEVSRTCSIDAATVTENDIASVKISVTSAGYDIYYNGNADNEWESGKTIPISELADSYAFQLQTSQDEEGTNPPPAQNGDVQINIKNPQNGSVQYKIDDGSWTDITVGFLTLRRDMELNGLTSAVISIKTVPNPGQSLDANEMQNRMNAGSGDVQIGIDVLKSDAGYSFTYDSSKSYFVQIAFEGNGQEPPQGQMEDVDLSVSWSGSFGEIKVGGESVNLSNTSQHFTRLRVNEDMIDVSIQAEPTIEFSSVKINGNEKLTSGEKTDRYTFRIPKTDTNLSIEVATEQSNTYTIQWAYDDSFGEDAWVENGSVKMISGYKNGDGNYWHAESGSLITVKLIPDYGYQVVGANINGDVELDAGEEANIFTFEMPSAHVHFQGIFKKTGDIVSNSSSAVSGASFSGEAVAGTGGTAKMTITSAEPSDTAMVSGAIDTTKSVEAVDIQMDQLFYKNSADDVWITNKTELSSEAQVSLTVNQTAGDYAVLRDHEGMVEEIEADYNASTNTITFSSDKYSTYTLVPLKKATGSQGGSNNQPSAVKNKGARGGGASTEAAVSYVPLPIGDVVGGKDVNNWKDLDKVLGEKKMSGTQNAAGDIKSELVQLRLRGNNTTVPASTFTNLYSSGYSGLHLFTGNGTAVTFINDAGITGQKTINIGCTTLSLKEKKIIAFKENSELNATAMLHAIVPAGTKMVSVYYAGADKKRAFVAQITPTEEGRLCFELSRLGRYELLYID